MTIGVLVHDLRQLGGGYLRLKESRVTQTTAGYRPGMSPKAAGGAARKPSGRGLSLPAAADFLPRSCV